MEIKQNFTNDRKLSLVSYTSKFETIIAILLSLSFVLGGVFLSFNGKGINGVITGLLSAIFFFSALIEKLNALFFKGITIKADENGLFIKGQTTDCIRWDELKQSQFIDSIVPFAQNSSFGYNLSVSKKSRKLIKRSYVFLYTKRWIWLTSFGTTASRKDIRQVLEFYLPHSPSQNIVSK